MDAQPMRRAGNDSSPAGGHRPAIPWGNPCVWDGSGGAGSARSGYPAFYGVFGVMVEVYTNQLVNTIGRDSRDVVLGWEEASARLTPGVGTGESPPNPTRAAACRDFPTQGRGFHPRGVDGELS